MAALLEHHSLAGVAPKTTVPERSRAPIPPYSRRLLGLIHSKWGQALPADHCEKSVLGTLQCEERAAGHARGYMGGGARIKTLGSLNSSTAKRTPSRPNPESFMPP
jgi:hypothetical protein